MITQDNLVLLKAQNQSDFDDGGGLPTSHTVPNHTSNALFPDVSDTDRMMGRVRLRKIFLGVRTANDELVQSARLIFTKIPQKMSVFAFKASTFNDKRTHAKNRIESYLSRGSRWSGHLLESHLKGQRVIQLSLDEDDVIPPIGSSLVLIQNENQADEYYQFVRVMKVETSVRKFYIDSQKTVNRLIASCELTDALRYDFEGLSVGEFVNRASDKRRAVVRDTFVADAAQYYSASHLAEPISAMTTQSVQLQSTFVQVVPSTQIETPLVQNNIAGKSRLYVAGGETVTQTIATAQSTHIGTIVPSSLTATIGGVVYKDVLGEIKNGNTIAGVMDYETGIISWNVPSREATLKFTPAGTQTGVTATAVIKVPKVGAGFNYVHTLPQTPLKGSVSVSYQAGGEIYHISETGGQGTLTVNDKTLVITTNAIADSESLIIISYGMDNGAISVGGIVKPLYSLIKTDKIPLTVSMGGKGLNFDVIDGGIRVYFDQLPSKGEMLSLKGAVGHTQNTGAVESNNSLTITLDNPIAKGTLSIEVMGVLLGDDGAGNVVFRQGYEKQLVNQSDETGGRTPTRTNATMLERTTNAIGEVVGTVDYISRTIIINKPLKVQTVQTQNQSTTPDYMLSR